MTEMLTQPTSSCPNCWRAGLNTRPRTALGYCWHGKIAWRLKSGADLAVAPEVTREEHRAMLEYVNDMESVTRPTKSRDACAASAER